MIKMNENVMEQCVGTHFIHHNGQNLKGKLDEDVHTKNGLMKSMKAATRRDSNIVWTQEKNFYLLSSDSGTHKWCNHQTRFYESCINSEKLERTYLPQRFCVQPTFFHTNRTRGKRKGKQRRKTNCFLHASWSIRKRYTWRRRIEWRFFTTKESPLS